MTEPTPQPGSDQPNVPNMPGVPNIADANAPQSDIPQQPAQSQAQYQPVQPQYAQPQPQYAPQTQPQFAQQQPPMQHPHMQLQKATSGMAITALVLGIIGVVLSWIPIVNNLAAVLGVIGVVFGVIAIVKTGPNGKKKGRGLAIAGTILSVLAFVFTLGTQALYGKALDSVSQSIEDSSSQTSDDAKSDDSAASSDSESSATAEGEGDVDSGNYHIKLISAKKSVKDYDGKPTVALTYEITNKQDKNSNFLDVSVRAFQNKKELETAMYLEETPEGYNAEDSVKKLQPGGKMTVVAGFVLEDESSPVEVEAEGTVDLTSEQIVKKTYELK